MKKKPHFTKGRTGEVLASIASDSKTPLSVTLRDSVAKIHRPGYTYFGLTVRGSSRCRRKQARELQRWLAVEQAKRLQ